MPSAKAPSSSAGAIATDFRVPEHVGEPEPDEPDVALFDGAEDELLLTVHGSNPAAPVSPAGNCDMPPDTAEGPGERWLPGGPSSCGGSGQRKRTLTCSSLPPSAVFATVIDVPEPATLVEFSGSPSQ